MNVISVTRRGATDQIKLLTELTKAIVLIDRSSFSRISEIFVQKQVRERERELTGNKSKMTGSVNT